MAKIGTLQADLKLESASFIRDMKKAADATARNTAAMNAHMSRLHKSFGLVATAAKTFLLSLASAATVRSLISIATSAVSAGAEIATAATKMGLAAGELQRLRFASDQAGVGISELDVAFKKFQSQVALGKIAAEGRTMGEAFTNFIKKIADAPTQIDKIAIAYQGLGRQAYQTGLVLANAGDAFQKSFKDAFFLSHSAVKAAVELDNEWKKLSNSISAGFQTGFLEQFSKSMGRTKEQLQAINRVADVTGRVVGASFRTLANSLTTISNAYQSIKNQWDKLPASLRTALSIALNPFGAASNAANYLWEGNGRSQANRPLPQFPKTASDAALALGEYAEAAKKSEMASESFWKATVTVNEELVRTRQLAQQVGDTIGSAFADTMVDAIIQAKDASEVLRESLKNLMRDLARIFASAAFQSIIGNVAMPGGSAGSGLLGSLFHGGGVVGQPTGMRRVPIETFMGAPRLHRGLMSDEFPAILQRGETVIPKDGFRDGSGTMQMVVDVRGAQGNEEIRRMVQAGVAQGLNAYDRALPGKMPSMMLNAQMRQL